MAGSVFKVVTSKILQDAGIESYGLKFSKCKNNVTFQFKDRVFKLMLNCGMVIIKTCNWCPGDSLDTEQIKIRLSDPSSFRDASEFIIYASETPQPFRWSQFRNCRHSE